MVALATAVALLLVACSSGDDADTGQATEPSGLRVVTTVSPITSIVENIGGTRIVLEGIIP